MATASTQATARRNTATTGPGLCAVLLCWLLWGGPFGALAQPVPPAAATDSSVVQLRDTTREYHLGHHWDVLALRADSLPNLSFQQVSSPAWAARFRRSQQDVPAYGGWRGTVWLRGTVVNGGTASTAWLLRALLPPAEPLAVFVVDAAGRVQQLDGGPGASYATSHAEPDRRFNFALRLPPGQPVTLYVRTVGGLLDLRICERHFLQHFIYWETFLLALFLGTLLMLALYNAFLFVSIRERSYLYYVGYVLTFGLLVLQMKSLLYLWTLPLLEGPWDAYLQELLIGANLLFGNLMARAFLDTRRLAPRLDWLLRVVLLATPLPLLAGVLGQDQLAMLFSVILPLVSSFTLIVVGTAVLRTGYRPARYYMAGWGVVIVSIVAYNLAQLNILPANGWTIDSSSGAWGLEMMFLSLGLADRVNLARLAQQRAQEDTLAALLKTEDVQLAANRQLATRAAELEQANHELQASLATTDKLQTLDGLKTNFFTNISHEFRTPLTLILGPAEEMAAESSDPAARRSGGLILRNAQRLLRLINQLLDLSKLEAGAMHLAPARADIAALARQLAATFASMAEAQGIRFSTQGPVRLPFVFDAAKLEIVLTNLLSNALRFTPAGGEVALTWCELPATATGPPTVELVVRDTGPGIAAAQQPHLFDRFYQGAHPTTPGAQPGTGVGLALVKELTELHGGSVAVHSTNGRGATFTVRLPAGLVPAAPESAEGNFPHQLYVPLETTAEETLLDGMEEVIPAPEADLVLFIEDNADVREFIRTSLAPAGYRLLEATDGRHGLELALEHVPDLVVSDVMMPGLDGYGVVRQLKAHPATSHVPVVLLTAKATATDRLEGLETGADAYLSKPFAARELRAQVRNLLALRERTHSFARTAQQLVAGYDQPGPEAPAAPHLSALDQRFLNKVAASVEENLAESDFDVDQLSSAVALSRTQMQRKLRALTGQAPAEYIRLARLHRALELLREQAGTVSEIGYQVGFVSPAHFSRVFARQYGYPPSEVGRQ